jgi:pyruvate/2-oxoglutarate dehydrogenase complex dihydrolipoamide acyltransferase (E2) component
MIAKIFIPKLGMTMEKATIAEWQFRDGDSVQKDSPILVIDTEKVASEIEAPISGKLAIDASAVPGAELPCGAVIGYVAETQEEYDSIKQNGAAAPVSPTSVQSEVPVPAMELSPAVFPAKGSVKSSPLARRVAAQNGVDLATLSGTGPGGRIVKRDVVAAIEKTLTPVAPLVAPLPVADTSAPVMAPAHKEIKKVIPLTGARKAISDHLQHSHAITAPVSVFTEVDMTEMIALRNRLLEKGQPQSVKITFTDLFVLIVAKVLRQAQLMNSSLINGEIIIWESINIGIAAAVTTPSGANSLVVPVIHNADRLSLAEISGVRSALTDKARKGELTVDEMSGGTFTITNTGTYFPMWHLQTPIINHPQAAILGTSGIVDRPVIKDKEIVIRPLMPMSLTFDHRIMDGEPPAKFVMRLHEMMADPDLILL